MSGEVKHTPGPWEVTSVSIDTGNVGIGHREGAGDHELRIIIAEVTNAASFGDMLGAAMARGGGSFRQDDCHTQFANARLIAAAPEMLEALKSMVAAIGDWTRPTGANGMVPAREDHPLVVAARAATTAIAKAEGQS